MEYHAEIDTSDYFFGEPVKRCRCGASKPKVLTSGEGENKRYVCWCPKCGRQTSPQKYFAMAGYYWDLGYAHVPKQPPDPRSMWYNKAQYR